MKTVEVKRFLPKLWMLFPIIAFTLIFSSFFAACDNSPSQNIEAEKYDFYDCGEQTVVLNLTDDSDFKSTVAVSDIEFTGELVGRTVTNVECLGNKQIRLTLGGKCSITDMSTNTAIVVKANAISSSKDYSCSVFTIEKAGLKYRSSSSIGANNVLDIEETFGLTSGNFIAANLIADNIVLKNPTTNASLKFSYDEEKKELTVKVLQFDVSGSNYPIVEFSSAISDLDRQFTETIIPLSLNSIK